MPLPVQNGYYPPVAFYFKVNIVGFATDKLEGDFMEVSGLTIKLGVEPVKEGGENRFTHRFPKPPEHGNLVLKRGMLLTSGMIKWARDAVENFNFKPANAIVNLKDADDSILAAWTFYNAYPVSLAVSDLKAKDGDVVIETLELAYQNFVRTL